MGRTTFTNITPLPASITREIVIDFLHNHLEMIDLNPLIIERHRIEPPPHAAVEEHRCIWYSLTDRIDYMPGVSGKVSYTCAFHDLPKGLQTHCFAAMGLEIRDHWSIGGSLPGEPAEPVELGINAPMTGLYLREDVDLRCNSLMIGFVKKTLKKAHGSLVNRLAQKAGIVSVNQSRQSMPPGMLGTPPVIPSPSPITPGSESSGVSSRGPFLPPINVNHQSLIPGLLTPPAHQQQDQDQEQPWQQRMSGSNYGLPASGSLDPPGQTSGDRNSKHSGPVYRDDSSPEDYVGFSNLSSYEKMGAGTSQDIAPSANTTYRPPLEAHSDRRVRQFELE